MGYFTRYDMNTMGNAGKYKIEDIIKYMRKEFKKSQKFYPFCNLFEDYEDDESMSDFSMDADNSYKWYDHEEEMIELSVQFPEIVFCIYGVGEENNDMWYEYFKNGKKQYCPAKITFDDYDESKLE